MYFSIGFHRRLALCAAACCALMPLLVIAEEPTEPAAAAPPVTAPTHELQDASCEARLENLCQRASRIAHGRIVARQCLQIENHIWTRYQLEVEEWIKGKPLQGKIMEIYQPGGELNGIRQIVSGTPHFKPDEELIVFTEGDPQMPRIAGDFAGCLRIRRLKWRQADGAVQSRSIVTASQEWPLHMIDASSTKKRLREIVARQTAPESHQESSEREP